MTSRAQRPLSAATLCHSHMVTMPLEAQAAPSFKNKASDQKFKDRNGRTIEPKGGIRFRDIQVGDTAHTTTT